MITFKCPACSTLLRVANDKAGRSGKCPGCGGAIRVPHTSPAATATPVAAGRGSSLAGGSPATGPARLAEPLQQQSPDDAVPWPEFRSAPPPVPAGPACPSCRQGLDQSAKVCVRCGIYVRSGRPLVTARGLDEDEVHVRAEEAIGKISWLVWSGICPIHSEGGGARRPLAVWVILGATVIASLLFLVVEITGSSAMQSAKGLMLWPGHREPSADFLLAVYDETAWGDSDAFWANLEEIVSREQSDWRHSDVPIDDFRVAVAVGLVEPGEQAVLAAHQRLSDDQQAIGHFSITQLVTHALLHGGLLHLAGNMVFFMVLGLPVNRAIGNLWMAVLYPLLAIGAAIVQLSVSGGGEPVPMLGASGAVMGIAGAYLVLFPAQKLYMAAWLRMGLLMGFRLLMRVFRLPGFVVVLAYIGMDVLFVSIGSRSGVAYWAHIGGFACGVAAAVGLLAARRVHTGSDLLSLILGRWAWPIVGTPASHHQTPAATAFIYRQV